MWFLTERPEGVQHFCVIHQHWRCFCQNNSYLLKQSYIPVKTNQSLLDVQRKIVVFKIGTILPLNLITSSNWNIVLWCRYPTVWTRDTVEVNWENHSFIHSSFKIVFIKPLREKEGNLRKLRNMKIWNSYNISLHIQYMHNFDNINDMTLLMSCGTPKI